MTENTMTATVDQQIMNKAKSWLDGNFDEETKQKVRELIESNPTELTDAFYRDLEFGTGGLRGIMGAGTNRMNKYTVGMATQGLSNYLKKMFPGQEIRVALSFDSRNNSREFANVSAEVLSANGFSVFIFDDIRPTPELSFAIRYLKCQSGIMITASHNPKEYNGYKAYWDDGAQMIAPHDENVIEEVQKIRSVDEVSWTGRPENIFTIGQEIDEKYLEQIMKLSLSGDAIRQQHDLKIVYTPLHGCGRLMVPEILRRYGFDNVTVIREQSVADGNFPTVRSPNPEEPDALNMAITKAKEINGDLVMATDPDADRVGIAVKNHHGEFVLLNGNQTAAILFYYVLNQWKERGMINGNQYIVSTIVTTGLLSEIGKAFGVDYYECLTGFKYIADVIRTHENKAEYIIGGEESFGYLAGSFVRDKDAVSACALIAEATAWCASNGLSLFDLLISIYTKFGFYKEQLLSITKKGKSGAEEIEKMMINYRQDPPKEINHSKVIRIMDYQSLEDTDIIKGTREAISLPSSNVIQFFLEDGSRISVRPSGTEPKIKFYFGVQESLSNKDQFDIVEKSLDNKIKSIISSMNLQ